MSFQIFFLFAQYTERILQPSNEKVESYSLTLLYPHLEFLETLLETIDSPRKVINIEYLTYLTIFLFDYYF